MFQWRVYKSNNELFVPLKITVRSSFNDIVSLLAKFAYGEVGGDVDELDDFRPSRAKVENYIRENYRTEGSDDTWTWHDGMDQDEVEPYMQWAKNQIGRLWPDTKPFLKVQKEL